MKTIKWDRAQLSAVAHFGKLRGAYFPPFLRSYKGDIWTVATNAHVLLAVRGRYTRRLTGPDVRPAARLGRRKASWSTVESLREFLKKHNEMEAVDICGTTIDPYLLKRFMPPPCCGEIALRPDVLASALRIEGDGWFVVVMERRAKVRARFDDVRRTR